MLIHALLFAVALGAIEALARGRGGQPGIWGMLGVVAIATGFLVGRLTFGRNSLEQWALAWGLLAVVAIVVRFAVGARKAQPDGMWSCPNCHMVNEASYVVCQACEQPWAPT